MKNELFEIENILEEELKLLEELENLISHKKELIIKGDIVSLAKTDENISKCEANVQKLIQTRVDYGKKIGNQGVTLSEIIEKTLVIDQELAERLKVKKSKMNEIINNIKKTNSISHELLKHGLNLIQSTIGLIQKSMNPEKTGYNNTGKININQNYNSSIVREA